ncbi:MAG TPA: M13 family metallopeptidase, partial [Duganella sp.]|nr:M13 family metallopeptidase [Duganella sp.]
ISPAALPYTPGLDPAAMDRDADPCEDFYQYSCGGWMRNNPIPASASYWSVYSKLAADNQRYLWELLQQIDPRQSGRGASEQKLGDYFAACMDAATIERRGAAPLRSYLDAIGKMRSKRDLPAVLALMHLQIGSEILFQFTAGQDFSDAGQVIAYARAADLSLPSRDYYLNDDAASVALRDAFRRHVARTFIQFGKSPAAARHAASRILRMETALAGALLSPDQKRDPLALNHPASWRQLQALTPTFGWAAYLDALGLPAGGKLNITEPAYLRALEQQLRRISLAQLKDYLRWQAIRQKAAYLSEDYAGEHFAFYQNTLLGVPQQQPRWQRCVALVDRHLGDALGELFVRRTFSPERRREVVRMTRQIEAHMRAQIDGANWMSADTRQKAQRKLAAMTNKIGYPDQWRDYAAYRVRPDDFAGNAGRGVEFETRRVLAQIGKPVDRAQWIVSAPTVNAFYAPQKNEMYFPAGVLQPPLYDPAMDAAPNYGNTGATIGHELTHGFDDQGRQFDAQGNLSDWWGAHDSAAFKERAQCVAEQYGQYVVIDDIKVNSNLTLGEDLADAGGLMLAWLAWKTELGAAIADARDGLSAEQRFFVGYAQSTCENTRPEQLRADAINDPHTPAKYRVNGVLANMPDFARAFACKPRQAMVREKACRVW